MTEKLHLDHAHLRDLLTAMLRIRRFEEKCFELYQSEKIRGYLHLYDGEEAVSVGVIRTLRPDDAIVATYREHGQALARGIGMNVLMAELYGKQEGCCRGRGGSMHIFDRTKRFYGGNAIVGGGLPLAVGVALGDKMQGRTSITACFFGEGAVDEGSFHESMNLASLWRLPVLFVCENNLYSMGMALERAEAEPDITRKAAGYRVTAEAVDGMDVVAVEVAAQRAVSAVRETSRPYLLECRTYRFSALDVRCAALSHEAGNRDMAQAGPDRSAPLLARAIRTDACRGNQQDRGRNRGRNRCRRRLCRGGNLGARRGTGTLRDHGSGAAMNSAATPPKPQRMTYREACKQAIRAAILADPRVFLMGEDVARYGGSYAVTKGLAEELGEEKIRDTPLSEAAYVGAGIGAAIAGMRPIVEIMTVNFSLLALDQIVNNAATIPHMSGGQLAVPLVIRMATGAGRQLAAQHSHSLEGWYAHIPGLKVLAPATIEDARYMLQPALEDPNPVLIFEHIMLYNREDELDP